MAPQAQNAHLQRLLAPDPSPKLKTKDLRYNVTLGVDEARTGSLLDGEQVFLEIFRTRRRTS